MAYSETYDPLIGSEDGEADRQVRDFKVDRMFTGNEKVIRDCEQILDQIITTDQAVKINRKITITDQLKHAF